MANLKQRVQQYIHSKNKLGETIEELIPIEFIQEDGYAITKSGRVSIAYYVDFTLETEAAKGANAYKEIHQTLSNALNAPAGTQVQFATIFHETNFVYDIEDKHSNFVLESKKRMVEEMDVLSMRTYMYIVFPQHKKDYGQKEPSSSFFHRGKSLFENPLEGIKERVEQAFEYANKMKRILSRDIQLTQLNQSEIEEIIYRYFNLDFDYRKPCNTFSRTLYNQKGTFKLGEKYVSVISMSKQGDEVDYSTKNSRGIEVSPINALLFDCPFEHIVHQTLEFVDMESELRNISMNQTLAEGFALENKSASSKELNIKIQEIEEMTDEILQKRIPLMRVGLSVIVWDSNPSNLEHKVAAVTDAYKRTFDTSPMVESYDACNLFFSQSPMAGENYRQLLMPKTNALCYINTTRPYISEKGFLFFDRQGYPVMLNFNKYNAQNKVVCGPTGSGKSATMNGLLEQHLENDDDVILIDVDGSYKNLYLLAKEKFGDRAQYFEYNSDTLPSFAPFNTVPRDEKNMYILSVRKINYLQSLIGQLLCEENEKLGKKELSILSSILSNYYNDLNRRIAKGENVYASIDTFYKYIEPLATAENFANERAYFDINALLIILKNNYITGAPYGTLLNGSNAADWVHNRFTVIDMKGIKDDKNAAGLTSLNILDLVADKIEQNKNRRKEIYMDETWSLLFGILEDFIVSTNRTIRKNHGSINLISQMGTDIANSTFGSVILGNSALKILLSPAELGEDQKEETARIFGLTDKEVALWESLRKDDANNRREFLLKTPYGSKVYWNTFTREQVLLFDSREIQRTYLQNEAKRLGSIQTAVMNILDQELGE